MSNNSNVDSQIMNQDPTIDDSQINLLDENNNDTKDDDKNVPNSINLTVLSALKKIYNNYPWIIFLVVLIIVILICMMLYSNSMNSNITNTQTNNDASTSSSKNTPSATNTTTSTIIIPPSVNLNAITSQSIPVTWISASPATNLSIVGYKIGYYQAPQNNANYVDFANYTLSTLLTNDTTSFILTSLTPQTVYKIILVVYLSDNSFVYSDPISTYTHALAPTLVSKTATQINLSWIQYQNSIEYDVYMRQTSANGWNLLQTVNTSSPLNCSALNLLPLTSYDFYVLIKTSDTNINISSDIITIVTYNLANLTGTFASIPANQSKVTQDSNGNPAFFTIPQISTGIISVDLSCTINSILYSGSGTGTYSLKLQANNSVWISTSLNPPPGMFNNWTSITNYHYAPAPFPPISSGTQFYAEIDDQVAYDFNGVSYSITITYS